MLKKRPPLRLPAPRVGCPFCWEWLPAPQKHLNVFSGEGCRGGRCRCGAVFVLDETGRSGGQALLDGLVLACDGDLDRAIKLQSDLDYQVETRPLQASRSRFSRRGQNIPSTAPKVWVIKLSEADQKD